ncbi:MAG TPA: hypothetical protein VGJ05_07335 [Fimbriiglobus sp.]|jgi:hypothetical protein
MDTESPPPRLPPEMFHRIRDSLASAGPVDAADRLIESLREADDPQALFYALLLKSRVALGVTPFPTGPSADLPADVHAAYEDAIRIAARDVGHGLLAKGNVARAWPYFRLIQETDPVKQALESYRPGPEDDPYPVIDIAWQQGQHPTRGFDLILDRQGICSAITLVSGSDLSTAQDVRDYCVGKLVRALTDQLKERLIADRDGRGMPSLAGASVMELIAGAPELFDEDGYHIDLSHLMSVVQLALGLPGGMERDLAVELCEYGRRLGPGVRGKGDLPFDEPYSDQLVYLNALSGRDLDEAVLHFTAKADRAAAEGNPFAVEAVVNLFVRLGRDRDALALASRHLAELNEGELGCPPATELARRVGDFGAVIQLAEAKGDAVTFLAGLIAGSQSREAKPGVEAK